MAKGKEVDVLQGTTMNVNGMNATMNVFDAEETIIIYMALGDKKEQLEYSLSVAPRLSEMSKEDRQDFRAIKKLVRDIDVVIKKLEMTFKSLGVSDSVLREIYE